jgi:hypothetical protein
VNDGSYKIYCLRGVEVEDVFAVVPCFNHLRDAFAKLAEGHRGRAVLIRAADLAAVLAEKCRMPMDSLIFPARAYLDYVAAPHAISMRGGKYLLPVEVLKRFAEDPPKVPARCPRVVKTWRMRPRRVRLEITTVKLPVETLEALDKIAEARNMLRSAVIREALAEYVERHYAEYVVRRESSPPKAEEDDMPIIEGR